MCVCVITSKAAVLGGSCLGHLCKRSLIVPFQCVFRISLWPESKDRRRKELLACLGECDKMKWAPCRNLASCYQPDCIVWVLLARADMEGHAPPAPLSMDEALRNPG